MSQMPAVAKKVFYPCKKCEVDRYQVVLAHTSPNTARLECEVCKSKNAFKVEEPKLSRARSTVPKRSNSTGRAAAHLARWTELRERTQGKPTPYNMRSAFEVGSILEHPKFGVGFVVQMTGQAIHVIFEDAERSLVHNRA